MSKLGQKFNRSPSLIRHPVITEKSSALQEAVKGGAPVYIFEVDSRATKAEIKMLVKHSYKVLPTKINIIRVKPKRFVYRGRPGEKTGFKKAMVYLKPGEKLDIVS